MRRFLTLLTASAILAAVPTLATAGPLTKPPKLEKMIKSPVHKKAQAPESFTGPQGGGHKCPLRRG
jgi:hypothetical protein